jgi:nucleoid-associated protein YgaU
MTIVLPDKEQVVAKDAKPQGTALVSSSAVAAPGPTGSTGSTGTTGATHLSGNPSAAVTVALPPIDERTQYRVQAGESLYKISLKLYGRGDKVNAIYDLNKDAIGANRNHLKAGTVLKLPDPPTAGATAAR